jgi:hypothetical protein
VLSQLPGAEPGHRLEERRNGVIEETKKQEAILQGRFMARL